jgi:hypothetical protein
VPRHVNGDRMNDAVFRHGPLSSPPCCENHTHPDAARRPATHREPASRRPTISCSMTTV